MSQDRPNISDLLATVREFLESLAPRLPADARFQGRIASYFLEICERELALGSRAKEDWCDALAHFLNADATTEIEALASELSRRIRAGECDLRWEETAQLVLRHLVSKVSIVRPDHLAAIHVCQPTRARQLWRSRRAHRACCSRPCDYLHAVHWDRFRLARDRFQESERGCAGGCRPGDRGERQRSDPAFVHDLEGIDDPGGQLRAA
jgi:hypothetical protein